MNYFKTILLTLLLITLSNITATAYDFCVNGIFYDINGNEATVTYKTTGYNSYSGEVIIPSTVTYCGTTYTVSSIGDHAFQGCSGLTNVAIPNSVTAIGKEAFSWCTGLISVDIPNSVETVGYGAFDNTPWFESLPDGMVYFGQAAFKYKGGLFHTHTIRSRTITSALSIH